MAIRGEKFLKVSKAGFFAIKPHALKRIEEYTGLSLDLYDAFGLFSQSTQLTYSQMWLRGYRPAYVQRKKAGVATWYFELEYPDHELIAVIAQGKYQSEYEWVTTYSRNQRNDSNILWHIQDAVMAA